MTEPTIDLHRSQMGPVETSNRRERRAATRTPVPYVRCFSPAPGIIFNVSRRGIAIETFRSFKRGEGVFLTGELAGRPKRTFGTVKWCRRIATAAGSSSPVYQVGVSLAKPLESQWFEALLERAAPGATEPRMRTAAPRPEPAIGEG